MLLALAAWQMQEVPLRSGRPGVRGWRREPQPQGSSRARGEAAAEKGGQEPLQGESHDCLNTEDLTWQ